MYQSSECLQGSMPGDFLPVYFVHLAWWVTPTRRDGVVAVFFKNCGPTTSALNR
jgi:hypothetical protein